MALKQRYRLGRRIAPLSFLLGGRSGLPRKLRSPAVAKWWGSRYSGKWANEYGALYLRYRTLSKMGGLPAITEDYIRRKIGLGSDIASTPRSKENVRAAFSGIKGMRKDTLYTMAMLPFNVLKREGQLERLEEEALKVQNLLRTSFGSAEASRRAAGQYRNIYNRLQTGKKQLENYSEKLKIFRAALQEIEPDSERVWGQRISPRTVLNDLDKIEKHVAEAQERFEAASRDMERKSRTVEGTSDWTRHWRK